MKRFFLLLSLLSFIIIGKAQTDSIATNSVNSFDANVSGSIASRTADLVTDLIELQIKHFSSERYKIYPTENIYVFIKLDTQTGLMELIQWSLKSENEFSVTLNSSDLSVCDGLNSFELYPTNNIYQFILLDRATGRTWHVQWANESSKRWVRRIN